jgi:hypothetical protein
MDFWGRRLEMSQKLFLGINVINKFHKYYDIYTEKVSKLGKMIEVIWVMGYNFQSAYQF